MSEHRFDELSRTLAKATSRRAVLKIVAAGVTGLAGGWLTHEGASSAPACKVNADCQRDFVCLSGICCFPSESNCGGTCCSSEKLCCNGQCIKRSENNCHSCGNVCAANERCCGGNCVDVLSNSDHCGDCPTFCVGGTCEAEKCACSDKRAPCGGQGGPQECCPAGATCRSGRCVCGECLTRNADRKCVSVCPEGRCCEVVRPGLTICNRKCSGCLTCLFGVCKPDDTSCHEPCTVCNFAGNCVKCDVQVMCCDPDKVVCVQTCPSGQECDGGTCKPKKCHPPRDSLPASMLALADVVGMTLADAGAGCGPCSLCSADGRCISACSACQTCSTAISTSGTCVSICPPGQVCQNGACVPANLCQGVVCVPQDQCHVAGTCDPASGQCSNPVAPNGTACSTGICSNGQCTCGTHGVCPSGQTCCSNQFGTSCYDLQSDVSSCGTCFHGCNPSLQQVCSGGTCCSLLGAYCKFDGTGPCCGGLPCIVGSEGPSGRGHCGCVEIHLPCTVGGTPCCGSNCVGGVCS